MGAAVFTDCCSLFEAYLCRRNFGELSCMKLVLSELQRDLRHRLAVYAKIEGNSSRVTDKKNALLQNSQLYRLLQVVKHDPRSADRQIMVAFIACVSYCKLV